MCTSRIKRILALLLLPALAVPVALADDASVSAPKTANYNTVTIEPGVFTKTASEMAQLVYPITHSLRFEGENARFAEYYVTRGAEVTEGMPLARFTLEVSASEQESLELSIRRARESWEEGRARRREEIDEARRALAALTDTFDREAARLRVRRLETSLRQFDYQCEHNVAQLQASLDKLMERRTETMLYAPCDGIVSTVTYKREGDAVSPWETLLVISDESRFYFAVGNTSLNYRYGMRVRIETGPARERVEYTGRIVAADDLLPEAERQGYALVTVDEGQEAFKPLSPKIAADTCLVGGVTVVPSRALTVEAGKHFVTKLVDGALQKRYVSVGATYRQSAWIVGGVSAGDVIVID